MYTVQLSQGDSMRHDYTPLYSRPCGNDRVGTIDRLKIWRNEIMSI